MVPTPAAVRVGVVGLGYVGLHLALAFSRTGRVVGYDVDDTRVQQLAKGHDRNGEETAEDLRAADVAYTSDPLSLAACDLVILAVPTPVDAANRPDLGPLLAATADVGRALRLRTERDPAAPPAIVSYESTVYPGCTEETCVPALAKASGLAPGSGFKVAYSPERVNPGDAEHTIATVVKIVSAEDPGTLETVASAYARVAKAGVYRAPDIRTAEAAKVIENTQRDLNIALMNELSILFHRMGIDTREVLAAAGTKWNFLRFTPGLVGGHCIPVDPYYLTHKAEQLGYFPEVILAGRRINDAMGTWVAQESAKLLARTGVPLKGARVLVLGVAFKEDVADARDTRVEDLAKELASYGCDVTVHDPLVAPERVRRLGLVPVAVAEGTHDMVVLAVPHKAFRSLGASGVSSLVRRGGVVVDVKGVLARADVERVGLAYWSL